MWIATMVLIAVVVYLLRYVCAYCCLVRLINWLLNCVKIITSAKPPAPGVLPASSHRGFNARATNDVDRVVFAAGEGVLTWLIRW